MHFGLATSRSQTSIGKDGATDAPAKHATFSVVQALGIVKGDSRPGGATSDRQADARHRMMECVLIIKCGIPMCRVPHANSQKDGFVGAPRDFDSLCYEQEVLTACPDRFSLLKRRPSRAQEYDPPEEV